MRLIFTIGIKWWNPVLYFSLVNVSRADRNQQSIMLFIIMALSFGIINSNQARTINSNMVDRVMYNNGAEVIIEPYNNLKHLQRGSTGTNAPASNYKEDYREPPYEQYMNIDGIESMTKVFTNDKTLIKSGVATARDVRLMGITPHEFGKTAWYRNDLMPHHINEYMNLLTAAPKGAILFTRFRDEYIKKQFRLKVGDDITFEMETGNRSYEVIGFYNTLIFNGNCALIAERYLKSDMRMSDYYRMYVKTSQDPAIVHENIKNNLVNRQIDSYLNKDVYLIGLNQRNISYRS